MRKYAILFVTFLCVIFVGCKGSTKKTHTDWETIKKDSVLKVLTLYSSSSYFLYKDQEMGYEWELITDFAQKNNLQIEVVLAKNEHALIDMLLRGEGDVIAYNLHKNNELKEDLIFCGPVNITHQVLVQQRQKNRITLSDVTQLVDKDVYVEGGSKYAQRIQNLNEELGGGIRIHTIGKDTLVLEDLIGMVSSGEIPYTLADDNIARLNRTYYNNLNIDMQVSFDQLSSWAVRKDEPHLAAAIDKWSTDITKSSSYNSISKRYFENSKRPPASKIMSLKNGRISQYDQLFKKYAVEIGWDWRLLASQAFQESRFDTAAISWAGAQGLMQLMPATAVGLGIEEGRVRYADDNVKAAVALIKSLNRSLSMIENKEERIKFILASYNSGLGHVLDAMALAQKYGKNPHIWDTSVAEYILLKSNPEYFNDPDCKFGYIRGRETYNYVNEVIDHYAEYKEKIPR